MDSGDDVPQNVFETPESSTAPVGSSRSVYGSTSERNEERDTEDDETPLNRYLLDKRETCNDNQDGSDSIEEDEELARLFQRNPQHIDVGSKKWHGQTRGQTPLCISARRGLIKTVKTLVEKYKADVSLGDDSAWKPLHHACSKGHVEIARFLLENKAEVDASDENGFTPLHRASRRGYVKIVRLLLQAGASVIATDKDGKTALHHASDAKADPRLSTPMERHMNDDESSGADTCQLIPRHHEAVVEVLLKEGAKRGAKTHSGDTALHLAAKHANHARAQIIVHCVNEDDISIQNASKKTALHVACERLVSAANIRCILDKMPSANFGESDRQAAVEHETLLWAANDSSRHSLAKDLLSKIKDGDKPDDPEDPPKDWDVIKWATHRGMHKVLWILITNSPPSPITDKRVKAALKLADRLARKTVDSRPGTGTNAKGGNGMKSDPIMQSKADSNRTREWLASTPQRGAFIDRKLVRDTLRDPPFTVTSRPREPFEPPQMGDVEPEILEDFEATIVRFYTEPNHKSALLRRLRSVKEIIYDSGPEKIMKDTTASLREVIEQSPPNPDFAQDLPHEFYINREPNFTWVHLPATNIVWMQDLVKRILKDEDTKESKERFYRVSQFFRDSWVQTPDRHSASRMMRPGWVEDEKAGVSAFYMPYLAFSTQMSTEAPAEYITDEAKTSFKDLRRFKKRHDALCEAYKNEVMHQSSTIDEAYYHFASDERSDEDRKKRNEDQVVAKHMKGNMEGKDDLSLYWPLIRVNQMWMWILDDGSPKPLHPSESLGSSDADKPSGGEKSSDSNKPSSNWLITSSSHPIDDENDDLLTGILDHLNKWTEIGGRRIQPYSAAEMGKVIIDYCIGFYERGAREKMYDDTKSIRQIFSDSINNICMDEASLFEDFRNQQNSHIESRVKEQGKEQGREDQKDPAHRSIQDIKLSIRKAANLSCDIKDIRDELNILKTIAAYQKRVFQDKKLSGKLHSMQAELTPCDIIKDLEEMENTADRVLSAVSTTISLEQSEISNFQANQGVRQGRTLMVFTVVTILFLPLSFLTSLFALDVASFQRAPGWVFSVIFTVSLAFFTPLASYAVWSDQITVLFHPTMKTIKTFVPNPLELLDSLNKRTNTGGDSESKEQKSSQSNRDERRSSRSGNENDDYKSPDTGLWSRLFSSNKKRRSNKSDEEAGGYK